MRGVCGTDENTSIAYVPIGLSGKCGVLRVQVVQGDVPFLLPAYFLTGLGAVIDMKHSKIMYLHLGVKQDMTRLTSGHVAVSIVEFGKGYHVPASFMCNRSQIWSMGPPPDFGSRFHAGRYTAMGPVATLVAASLLLCFPDGVAEHDGGDERTAVARCQATSPAARTRSSASSRRPHISTPSRCRCGKSRRRATD